MKITLCCRRLAILASISVLTIHADALEAAQGEARFYFGARGKVSGRLDTSILAVRRAPDAKNSTQLPRTLRRATKLSTQPKLVDAFSRDGVVFFKLGDPLKARKLLQLSKQLRRQDPQAQVGHPFKADGEELPFIVTDEFIARFQTTASASDIARLNRRHHVEVVQANPHVPGQFLLRATRRSPGDALALANLFHESPLTLFAQPNFLLPLQYEHTPSDDRFAEQWHLGNAGGRGFTEDADIDAEQAWDLTRGTPQTIIAVIDGGFEPDHPDLVSNHLINTKETRNGLDDDGNGYVDDIAGWNFHTQSDDLSRGRQPSHGQRVAGLVAAAENGDGVVGVCPRCKILLIAHSANVNDLANAFYYARDRGADVITNSWAAPEQPVLIQAIAEVSRPRRDPRGIPVFFAAGNAGLGKLRFPASHPDTIVAGGSDCRDQRFERSQYGAGLHLLGLTRQVDGSCGLVTTDLNDGIRSSFGGTSGAAPIVAGVAGLLLAAKPDLTPLQVQRLLQDTADKTQHSAANYSPIHGYSQPTAPPHPDQPGPTHGYGRVNALEAVRVVASSGQGGNGGRSGWDVMLRDNHLDWGNTEQPSSTRFEANRGFIPHWQSPDIKVDAPPFQPDPTTFGTFDRLVDEDPIPGKNNRVYVRLRNRGPKPAQKVTVSLHWTAASTALPALPDPFWQRPPGMATNANWRTVGKRAVNNLPYSGASVAGCPQRAAPSCNGDTDRAAITRFTFRPPSIAPSSKEPRHYSFLAVLHSKQDPVAAGSTQSLVADWLTPRDNNVSQRSVLRPRTVKNGHVDVSFWIHNPTSRRLATRINVNVPEDWAGPIARSWQLDNVPGGAFEMAPGAKILARLKGQVPPHSKGQTVTVRQVPIDTAVPFHGGLTIQLPD